MARVAPGRANGAARSTAKAAKAPARRATAKRSG
jgi:hypothetical protein